MTTPKSSLRYSGLDNRPWKVVNHQGKTLRYAGGDDRGKPIAGLSGYKAANEIAGKVGGVAVRA
jgi:hypothetical protein